MWAWVAVALALGFAWLAFRARRRRGRPRRGEKGLPPATLEALRRFDELYASTFATCSREAVRELDDLRTEAVGAVHALRFTLPNDAGAEARLLRAAEEVDDECSALVQDVRRRCGAGDAPWLLGQWHHGPVRAASEVYNMSYDY